MSFSENPYVHMNLATAPPRGQRLIKLSEYEQELWAGKEDAVFVGCDSCGATDVANGSIRRSDPIEKARKAFDNHIHHSHGRLPDDFQGWSWA